MRTSIKSIKRILLIIGCTILLNSNDQLFSQQFEYAEKSSQPRSLFLGFGLGINDYGLGLNLEVPISQGSSLNGNIGIGGWGLKLGGSINFYPKNEHNEFSIGYAYASGLRNFHTSLTVEPNGTQQTLDLDLYGVSTINLLYTYNIKIGASSKLAFSGGYAICLTSNAYNIKNSVTLDQTSKLVMDWMQPGGFIFGIKLMIGL
jgi:hypothetical protein